MRIFIAGASGFVGSSLSQHFLEQGFKVTGIGTSSQHPGIAAGEDFEWISADTTVPGDWQHRVTDAEVVINLSGRTIFHYWTKKYKKAIYDSRILTTRNLVAAMIPGQHKMLINASAVGIYGDQGDLSLTETASPGDDFLARVCIDWEREAQKAVEKEIPVSILRFGVILGRGGALSAMTPAFKWFVGGPIGSGRQWFPWVHINEVIHVCQMLIETGSNGGIYNLVGPEPVRQKTFAKALGGALSRPAILPVPSFAVRLMMGEMGASLLQSQRALPEQLVTDGYDFLYQSLDKALQDIFEK